MSAESANGSMKRLYLHIGLHKTGTTTIQQAITLNSKSLHEAGIISPRSGVYPNICIYHDIAWSLRDNPPGYHHPERGTYSDLIKEINASHHDKFLVSSEEFCTLEEQSIQKLQRAISKNIQVTIILYLRNPEQWLPSKWSQLIRQGHETRAFHEYYKNERGDNFYRVTTLWSTYFGKENICLRIYDDVVDSPGLLNDFWSTLDLPEERTRFFAVPQDANISSSHMLVNLILQLNQRMALSDFNRKEKPLVPRYYSWLWEFDSVLQHKYGKTSLKLSQEEREFINSKFTAHNKLIARDFLQRDELFPQRISPRLHKSDMDLEITQEDLIDILAFIGEKAIAYEVTTQKSLAPQDRSRNFDDAINTLTRSTIEDLASQAYLGMKIKRYRITRFFIKLLNFWQIRKLTLLAKQNRLSIPKLFNAAWYLRAYPEVKNSSIHPYAHFHLFWHQGYHPMPLFDVTWYITQYPKFYNEGLNPLEHYERIGQYMGYRPCALFDPKWYLAHYEDVQQAETDPLFHYCYTGWSEGRNPSPEFNTNVYLQKNPHINTLNVNPLAHYLQLHYLIRDM